MTTQTAITLPTAAHAQALVKAALSITVNSPDSRTSAQAMLERVRLAGRNLDADVKALKRPHQDAVKAIDEAARPLKALLTERDAALTQQLIAYQTFCENEARKAQAKELEKWERKVGRAETKAELSGAPVPIIPPPPVIAPPPKTVETAGGQQTIRVTKDWKLPTVNGQVLDKDSLTYEDAQHYGLAIPARYFYLNPSKVGQIVRAGGHVPGVEVVEVKGISVRKGA